MRQLLDKRVELARTAAYYEGLPSLFVAYEDLVEGAPGREGAWARVDAFLGAAPRPAPGAGGLRIIHTGPILEAVGNAGEVYETMRWACGPDLDLGGACAEVLRTQSRARLAAETRTSMPRWLVGARPKAASERERSGLLMVRVRGVSWWALGVHEEM